MTAPRDPDLEYDTVSEYDYGPGQVGPRNVDYGDNLPFPKIGSIDDTFEDEIAVRRTDSTDPTSTANFNDLGNPDRYGPGPALQQTANPARQPATPGPEIRTKVKRER